MGGVLGGSLGRRGSQLEVHHEAVNLDGRKVGQEAAVSWTPGGVVPCVQALERETIDREILGFEISR